MFGQLIDKAKRVTAQSRRELIDDLMEVYVEWREECVALEAAYQRWSSGAPADRDLGYAAYQAALDREAQASLIYAEQVDRVKLKLAIR